MENNYELNISLASEMVADQFGMRGNTRGWYHSFYDMMQLLFNELERGWHCRGFMDLNPAYLGGDIRISLQGHQFIVESIMRHIETVVLRNVTDPASYTLGPPPDGRQHINTGIDFSSTPDRSAMTYVDTRVTTTYAPPVEPPYIKPEPPVKRSRKIVLT